MPVLDLPSRFSSLAQEVAPDVYRLPTGISNTYFVALDADNFVLIDAGGKGYGKKILNAAADLFPAAKPRAILLTHGHFDHAGSLPELLAADWADTPVFAHSLEIPYLNAGRRYPPGDPTVGGMMAEMSRFLDTSQPTHVPVPVTPLPEDFGELEMMPGWQFRPSPGHTPGHVSFWNPQHRTLIAGDAIITMNQNNPLKALSQKPEINAPPPYATYNWHHARQSARALAELQPYYLCSGHGLPVHGADLAPDLCAFAKSFPAPSYGRYVCSPARFSAKGPVFIPPPATDYVKRTAILTTSLLAALGAYSLIRGYRHRNADSDD